MNLIKKSFLFIFLLGLGIRISVPISNADLLAPDPTQSTNPEIVVPLDSSSVQTQPQQPGTQNDEQSQIEEIQQNQMNGMSGGCLNKKAEEGSANTQPHQENNLSPLSTSPVPQPENSIPPPIVSLPPASPVPLGFSLWNRYLENRPLLALYEHGILNQFNQVAVLRTADTANRVYTFEAIAEGDIYMTMGSEHCVDSQGGYCYRYHQNLDLIHVHVDHSSPEGPSITNGYTPEVLNVRVGQTFTLELGKNSIYMVADVAEMLKNPPLPIYPASNEINMNNEIAVFNGVEDVQANGARAYSFTAEILGQIQFEVTRFPANCNQWGYQDFGMGATVPCYETKRNINISIIEGEPSELIQDIDASRLTGPIQITKGSVFRLVMPDDFYRVTGLQAYKTEPVVVLPVLPSPPPPQEVLPEEHPVVPTPESEPEMDPMINLVANALKVNVEEISDYRMASLPLFENVGTLVRQGADVTLNDGRHFVLVIDDSDVTKIFTTKLEVEGVAAVLRKLNHLDDRIKLHHLNSIGYDAATGDVSVRMTMNNGKDRRFKGRVTKRADGTYSANLSEIQ